MKQKKHSVKSLQVKKGLRGDGGMTQGVQHLLSKCDPEFKPQYHQNNNNNNKSGGMRKVHDWNTLEESHVLLKLRGKTSYKNLPQQIRSNEIMKPEREIFLKRMLMVDVFEKQD
jgi:hypothetical protein